MSASLLSLAGCSNETDIAMSDADKHPIMLSAGSEMSGTRAVITDGTDKTLNAFAEATDIWMVMQSEYKALSGDNSHPGELDYKGNKATTNCVTMGTTGNETATGSKENVVNFTTANKRYWDDAHARSSALSIWALAVPGVTGTKLATTGTWSATTGWCRPISPVNPIDWTIDWTIPTEQTPATVKANDLCFSNNVGANAMKFNPTTSAFESGKLIFYHALSKITIILKEGEGFDKSSSSDFTLDNITLKGFKVNGTFDVVEGEFSSTGAVTPITQMAQKQKTAADQTLEALVMPGTDLEGTLNDAISFSLDGNAFKVSAATLKQKLIDGGATSFTNFEAGKNYVFTFTINKTDIDVTATIAGWQDITAADEAPMINVQTCYGEEGTNFGKGFSFLRSTSLASGYANEATVSYAASKYTMSPLLYWPNHNIHYFFRGISPLISADGTPTDKVTGTNIAVQNVAYSAGTYPSDLMLGYPRTTTETCPHSNVVATNGICATEGTIRMNFQYVMSRVQVILTTNETDGATNKVKFDEHTVMEIVGGYKEGVILLQDGSSSFDGKTSADYTMHRKAASDVNYEDAVIPQSLDGLNFRITVTDTDGNQDKYETVLGIKEIEVTEGGTTKKINEWLPGKHYTYTLYITKTGVKVTATIKDWITASGGTSIWM